MNQKRKNTGHTIKVMYLMCMENIFGHGVFETQVNNLLLKLAEDFKEEIELSLVSVLPLFHISRKGVELIAHKYREQLLNMKQRFISSGIDFEVIYIPLPRFRIYLNILILPIFLFCAVPIVLMKIIKKEVEVVHCRSYLPALVILLSRKLMKKLSIVFDMRGLFPEEGVVRNIWRKNSLSYKIWKTIEKKLLFKCEKIVVLSNTFAEYLTSLVGNKFSNKIYVIEPAVDLSKFKFDPELKMKMKMKYKIDKRKVIVYCGNLGSWHNPETLVSIFQLIKRKIDDVLLLVLTNFDYKELCEIMKRYGLKRNDFLIFSLKPEYIPLYLSMGDYGVIPFDKGKNKDSVREKIGFTIGIKTGEYLACGLPIIVNKRAKGVMRIVREFDVGIIYDPERPDLLINSFEGIEKFYSKIQSNCIKIAENYFDIKKNAKRYHEIYKECV